MFLKRTTPYNIVIGGAAGAFPPMIGWAVSTNSISIESILLFLLIFLWTPPHFWSLCLITKKKGKSEKFENMTESWRKNKNEKLENWKKNGKLGNLAENWKKTGN